MRPETAEIIPINQTQEGLIRLAKAERGLRHKKKKANPGTPGYKWSAAQRRNFLATAARKKAARLKEKRDERRALRVTRRAALDGKGARRPYAERIEDAKDARLAASTGRKGGPGPEERLDAIVYLARAYAAYEHVPDDALLGLLALRTLQGRIK